MVWRGPATRHSICSWPALGGFRRLCSARQSRPQPVDYSDYLHGDTARRCRGWADRADGSPAAVHALPGRYHAPGLGGREAARIIMPGSARGRSVRIWRCSEGDLSGTSPPPGHLTAKIRNGQRSTSSTVASRPGCADADSLARPAAEGARSPIMGNVRDQRADELRAATELEVDLHHFRDETDGSRLCILQTPNVIASSVSRSKPRR